MNPERWRQIDRLLQSALDRQPDERRAFLDEACAGDEALRREVDSFLVASEQAGNFLNKPAFEDAAKMLAQEQAAHTTSPADNVTQKQSHKATTLIGERQSFPLTPGATLDGRYLIERELGRGGIGEVFLARNLKLLESAQVVIKVLQERLLSREDRDWIEKKFRNEIKALSRINHPGVVSAIDTGQLPDGRAYFVMQYVPGVTLRSVMAPGGMNPKRAGDLLRKIAQPLRAAHEQGVIHRDLKPENIMLQTAGDEEYVKIIDFGIATVLETADAASTLTRAAGTPAYMAPEQLEGRPTIASDIYGLGVIVFEMVTGHLPFNVDSETQLIELQRAGAGEKLRALSPGLSEAARGAILKALAFEPSDRYGAARDFSEAFNQALAKPNRSDPFETLIAPSPDIPAAGMRSRMRLWLMLATILAAIATGTIAWMRFSTANDVTAGVAQTNPPPAAERSLSYSLLALKNPKRHSGSQLFETSGDIIFEAGDQARLNVFSPQRGYLYVINEGPAQTNGLPDFTVLFPDTTVLGGSALINANQPIQIPSPSGKPEQDWFIFDREKGVEKIWLIWSEGVVPELENVKGWANPKDEGLIADPSQIKSVAQYLAAQAPTKPEMERNEASKWTRLKAKGAALVFLVELEHR